MSVINDKSHFQLVQIAATDGYPLSAALFEPDLPNGKTIVIASAMGVLQQYYYSIGEYLRQQGFRFITFDYRGIGLSAPQTLKGFDATLHHWGDSDLEGVLQYVKHQHPTNELQFMSHSVGGQIFGLAPSSTDVKRVAMVASQSGYWNLWPASGKLGMWAVSHLFIPTATQLAGYLPTKKLDLFENVPKGVANQWARWIRNPDYMFVDEHYNLGGYTKVNAPMRLISFSDDSYAPPATVDWLASRYTGAPIERIDYHPSDFGLKEIGHFAYFKRNYQRYFWEDLSNYLGTS